jgi:outer membrane protein OmpA-like peptidoglycan-associated protein
VNIQGHTDDVGDDAKNMALSENRAKDVRAYLISQGVDASRLTAKGFGETVPKVENDSEANRAMNRRTDFVIEKL